LAPLGAMHGPPKPPIPKGFSAVGKARGVGGPLAAVAGGTLASGLARQLTGDDPNSRTDDIISGATGGAVAGGALGATVGAPFFGIGAVPAGAIGAGLGAIGGGAYGYFSGGSDSRSDDAIRDAISTNEAKLAEVIASLGLTPQGVNSLRAQLDPAIAFAESSDQIDALYDQVAGFMPAIAAEDQIRRQSAADQQHRAAQVAAITAMLAPQIEQQNLLASQYAGDLSTAMLTAASRVSDPTLRSIYEAQARRVPLSQANTNRDSLQQLALAPAAFQAQGEIQAQLAAEAQAAGNPGFAAASSIEQLLAGIGG
jgi:hypothetical protein